MLKTETQKRQIGAQERQNLNVKEASQWASDWLGRDVTPSNISYLINYGRIGKVANNNGKQESVLMS